ncbi:MAG TPA: preQ(1) synthase [Burkholderiales bacterium]|nr:preQ(1) synthase [Burkholderiales bacterium]
MPQRPSAKLATFANPRPARDYRIHMEIPEFTCLCPRTGQPDFATLVLDYVPAARCVELKSLKLYVWSYRNKGAYHEDVTNRILDDLVRATRPRFMRLTAKFYVRGGIFTTVVAERVEPGWNPGPTVRLDPLPAFPSTRG